MKLLAISQYTPSPDSVVFRQSKLPATFALLVFGGLTAGLAYAILKQGWPAWLWLGVVVMVMVTKAFLSRLTATFKASNWTMSLDGSQLFIKFRTHLNHHFSDADEVIIALDADEILAARKHVKRIKIEKSDTTESYKQTSLELVLDPSKIELIDVALAEERRRNAPKIGISRTKNMHFFASVKKPDLLRVVWRSKSDFVIPNISRTLQQLAHLTTIDPDRVEPKRDSKPLDTQTESDIIERIEAGDVFGALHLLKQHYGYSTTEAKNFIDELTREAA